jgi:ABC-type dipeptide/oligopeptide/nickel transport system ATPase subunit
MMKTAAVSLFIFSFLLLLSFSFKTGSVDITTKAALGKKLFSEKILSKDSTIVLVEQNFLVASRLAEYYVIIEEGRSVQEGSMKDLANDKAAIHRYLGAA